MENEIPGECVLHIESTQCIEIMDYGLILALYMINIVKLFHRFRILNYYLGGWGGVAGEASIAPVTMCTSSYRKRIPKI